MSSVKIVAQGHVAHIYVDGVEIKSCRSYEIVHEALGLPQVKIGIIATSLEIEQSEAEVEYERSAP